MGVGGDEECPRDKRARNLLSWFGSSVLAKLMVRTVAVLTLSILIVEFAAYKKSSEQIIALTEQQQLSLTALFAERFDRAIQRIASDMQTIRDLPSLEEYYLNRQYDLLAEADQQLTKVAAFLGRVQRADPAYARLEIVDPGGAVVLAVFSGAAELTPSRALTGAEVDSPPRTADGLFDEGLHALDGDTAMVFSRALLWGEADRGTLRAYYWLQALTGPLARERLAKTGHLAVIADDGTVVYSPRGPTPMEETLAASLLSLTPGTHEITTAGGRRLLVSTSHLSSKGWTIAALVPRGELLAGLDATRRLVAALIVGNILVEFLFIVLFARRFITNPIRQLLAGTREVLNGNYTHRVDVASRDEFGDLAASFNAMTASLEHTLDELRGREQELSEAEDLLRQRLEQLEFEVAERARTEAALRDQSQLLRALHSAIPAPIFYKDADGVYLGCNEAFAHMVGRTEEEVVGRTVHDLAPPDSAARWADGDRRAMQSSSGISHEANLAGADGTVSHYVVHKAVFRRGEVIGGIVGVMLDITQRKALEAQLLHSQKMEAVGVMASGIAHDFNNVLQVISSYTRALLPQADEHSPPERALVQIQRATDRASDLVRDLLTFSKKRVSKLEPVDVNSVIERAVRLITRTIPRMIRVELDLSPLEGCVEADASQLEQVLVNLATNARDAMPDGGVLRFTTGRTLLDEISCRPRPGLAPGPFVVLTVADTGCGMDPATRSRVFEPFFTTKDVGMGTGLGLSSAYGIVRSHRGHIDCQSQPGKGTEFVIHLPLASGSERAAPTPAEEPQLSTAGGETILVVDDDPGVLEVSRMLLEDMGYSVVAATSGEQAIEIWRQGPVRPDIVILDLGMPGMGAMAFA